MKLLIPVEVDDKASDKLGLDFNGQPVIGYLIDFRELRGHYLELIFRDITRSLYTKERTLRLGLLVLV